MTEQYTYAVARIRAKELTLLDRQAVDQLMACHSYEECFRMLQERGWGTGEEKNTEQLLSAEMDKTWNLMKELLGDTSVFDVFRYPSDFNNMKAAIKAVVTGADFTGVFLDGGTIEPMQMVEAVQKNDFSVLPQMIRDPASEAYQTLLHTRDGQLCDIILDSAALHAILTAGKNSGNELIMRYAELTVAAANIKIAVRGCKTGKSSSFLKRAMVPCDTLDLDPLIAAACKNEEEIYAYLTNTVYSSAVDSLKLSPSAFEKWCDDVIISMIKDQKSNPFTVGPLAAFLLAKENEIKTARILLSGKLNGLDDMAIRERLREMYV